MRTTLLLFVTFFVFCILTETGCSSGSTVSNSSSPIVGSIAGNWHFVGTQSNPTGDEVQIVVEAHFDSQNQVTSAFAFTYHVSGLYYDAEAPCDTWPASVSASMNGQNVSLTSGSYQFGGTIVNGSITGSFTTTCSGISGGSFTASMVGDVPSASFSGITNENSFSNFPVGTNYCPFGVDLQSASLSSQNSSASLSGQFNCNSQVVAFAMKGAQVGYAFSLSGTFGNTVAFYPPQTIGIKYLYLFNPQTGSSGGALLPQ